ncbi:MAG: hypothetical protein R2705_21360 [Ilumatobacteraceae bacterium]
MTSRDHQWFLPHRHLTKQHTALPAPTKAECEARFGWHLGRNYMYSMKPVGELRRRTSAGSLTVDRTMDVDSMYGYNDFVDANGVVWELQASGQSVLHQPEGAAALRPGQPVFKKFVAADSAGGSFEVILMPNGWTESGPGSSVAAPSYQTNWLVTGTKQGTYNHYHFSSKYVASTTAAVNHAEAFVGHATIDIFPDFFDKAYVAPAAYVDSGADWKTYRARFEAAAKAMRAYSPSRLELTPTLGVLDGSGTYHKIEPDQVELVRSYLACADTRPDPTPPLSAPLGRSF